MALRDQWREFDDSVSGAFSPVCRWLLYICTTLTLLAYIARPLEQLLFGWMAMTPRSIIPGGQVWRLVTYSLLHGGIWHLAMNMLGIYYFGTPTEYRRGSEWFLKLSLVTVIFSALLHCLGSYLLVGLGAEPINLRTPMVGISGLVFALMMMAAIRDPDMTLIIFPLPIAIPLKYFVGIMAIMTLISIPRSDGIAHLAHLGGLIAGWYFSRFPDSLDRIPTPSFLKRRRRGAQVHYGGRGAWRRL